MKNKPYLFLSFFIVGLSLFLRLFKMANRAPFDWDQNRDYAAIAGISSGKATLIGPVAKGEGGFFLGPLYYYLATPAYLLMGSSPLALPVTSTIIDVLVVVVILGLFRKIISDYQSLAITIIWSTSWFAIEMSRISWNVALVPLWSVLFIWFLSQKNALSIFKVGLLGLLTGFSWHIHAALIPISLGIIVLYYKTWAISWKHVVAIIAGYILPLIPLILFDLRHSGLNLHLLTQMFVVSSHVSTSYIKLFAAIMLRLGKNTLGLFLGLSHYNLAVGYFTLFAAFGAAIFGKNIYRLSGIIIIVNILAVFMLRDLGFPEYYLALSYIPTLILFFGGIMYVIKQQFVLGLILLMLVLINISKYTLSETTFSLSRKMSVAKEIAAIGTPLDLRFAMDPGREGGIAALYKLYSGSLDESSHTKVMVTDQIGGPIILGGELATELQGYGGIRVAKIVVK